jgi:CRISPR-associated protein Cas1
LNPLHLTGYGVKIRVKNMRSRSDLHVTDGRDNFSEDEKTYSFRPRRIPYDSIIIDGHSGYVSLQAFHWLSRNKVPVFILNYDGSLINSILPPMPVKADLRVAQIDSYRDPQKRFTIAHAIVEAKIQRSLDVLCWLGERYDIERKIREAKKEASSLPKARTINDLRVVEARVAQKYWEAFQSVTPETFCFQSRLIRNRRPNNASDPVNLVLNYSYGVLEGEVRRAINMVGLEPSVGWLHEFTGAQTRESCVYDLMEPFRFLRDLTTMQAFESSVLDLKDFYFTGDDYSYKIEIEAKRRFLQILKERFNSGVKYRGKIWNWDSVIQLKTEELARSLLGESERLNFAEPGPVLVRADNLDVRNIIQKLSTSEAQKLGIGKSTLHYLRKNAGRESSFRIYKATRQKLGCETVLRPAS